MLGTGVPGLHVDCASFSVPVCAHAGRSGLKTSGGVASVKGPGGGLGHAPPHRLDPLHVNSVLSDSDTYECYERAVEKLRFSCF